MTLSSTLKGKKNLGKKNQNNKKWKGKRDCNRRRHSLRQVQRKKRYVTNDPSPGVNGGEKKIKGGTDGATLQFMHLESNKKDKGANRKFHQGDVRMRGRKSKPQQAVMYESKPGRNVNGGNTTAAKSRSRRSMLPSSTGENAGADPGTCPKKKEKVGGEVKSQQDQSSRGWVGVGVGGGGVQKSCTRNWEWWGKVGLYDIFTCRGEVWGGQTAELPCDVM